MGTIVTIVPIWTVHQVVGGITWCARRWDGTGRMLNAHSEDELVEYLEDQAGR